MANKVRCTVCKGYFKREEAVWADRLRSVCSEGCLAELRRPKERVAKQRKPRSIERSTALEVLERDGYRCRWCGAGDVQLHHILHRSQGGPHEAWNLISLCERCHHGKAHRNKKLVQPQLQAVMWLYYFCGRWVTVPEGIAWLTSSDSPAG